RAKWRAPMGRARWRSGPAGMRLYSPAGATETPFPGGGLTGGWILCSAHERAAQPRVQARGPRGGHVLARLQVRGAPRGDRAQARARDGRAQGAVALARVRPERVRRLALAAGSRAVRGLRGRAGERAGRLPARACPARADRTRDSAADRLTSSRRT